MEEETEFNPKGRRLCPDGTCVGLVGSDGRCGECGRVAGPATAAGAEAVHLDDAPVAEDVAVDAAANLGGGGEGGGFDPKRKLCEDGTCVGVVEADGKCNVCGRVASS